MQKGGPEVLMAHSSTPPNFQRMEKEVQMEGRREFKEIIRANAQSKNRPLASRSAPRRAKGKRYPPSESRFVLVYLSLQFRQPLELSGEQPSNSTCRHI